MEVREMGPLKIGRTPTNESMQQRLVKMLPILQQTKNTAFKSLTDEDEAIKYLVGIWVGLGRPEMQTIQVEPTGSVLAGDYRKIADELIVKAEEALQKPAELE